jgi:hypothetical protein
MSATTTPEAGSVRRDKTMSEGSHKVLVLDMLSTSPNDRHDIYAVMERIKAQKPTALALMSVLRRDGLVCTELKQPGSPSEGKVHFMTHDQATRWLAQRSLIVGAKPRRGAPRAVANPAAQAEHGKPAAALVIGIWSDGSLSVEGLQRKAVRMSADDVGALSSLLASLPEGALQALMDSPLRPQFALLSQGRSHPMSAQHARQLVDYLESLPSRLVRTEQAPALPWAGLLRPGTDHRTHRIAQPGEDEA